MMYSKQFQFIVFDKVRRAVSFSFAVELFSRQRCLNPPLPQKLTRMPMIAKRSGAISCSRDVHLHMLEKCTVGGRARHTFGGGSCLCYRHKKGKAI